MSYYMIDEFLFVLVGILKIRKARSKDQSVKEVLRRTQRPERPRPVPDIGHGRKSIKIGLLRRFAVFFNLPDRAYAFLFR